MLGAVLIYGAIGFGVSLLGLGSKAPESSGNHASEGGIPSIEDPHFGDWIAQGDNLETFINSAAH